MHYSDRIARCSSLSIEFLCARLETFRFLVFRQVRMPAQNATLFYISHGSSFHLTIIILKVSFRRWQMILRLQGLTTWKEFTPVITLNRLPGFLQNTFR